MSRDDRTSLFIESSGPNEEAVKKGFAWIYQITKDEEEDQDAILALTTKKPINSVIADVLGDSAARNLDQQNSVKIEHVRIHLMTNRIDPGGGRDGPVLAVYPDKTLRDKIDGMYNVSEVLVVPWSLSEVEYWIDMWDAQPLSGGGRSGTGTTSITDPVVEEAVDTIDVLVNRSTGITNSSDRSTAIETFKTLYDAGIQYDPDEIRAFLVVEKGWDPGYADDVKEVAEDVQAGKQLQYRPGGLRDDILEQWKEAAEKRT